MACPIFFADEISVRLNSSHLLKIWNKSEEELKITWMCWLVFPGLVLQGSVRSLRSLRKTTQLHLYVEKCTSVLLLA